MLRKTFFWLHLVSGVIAGLVIAIMSFTGAAIAFEKELVAWAERDTRYVVPPGNASARLPLNELLQRAREVQPEGRPIGLTLSAGPNATVAIAFGREATYQVNPYNGAILKPASTHMHDFMHLMERWHRFLGFAGESTRPIGKAITGACNLAFFFLAVSGLYLWWPRNWSWRGIKALAVFNFRLTGKARDFNWHNSVGLWIAPLLIMLTLTAIPISYRWGNALVYRLTGTEPPAQGAGPGPNGAAPAIAVPTPDASAKLLSYDQHLAVTQNEFPNWSEISFRLGNARGPGANSNLRREGTPSSNDRARTPQAINLTVRTADQWPLFSTTTLALDPFTGVVLRKEVFTEQNAGRRIRAWTRFLHTGEALGWPGKLLVALASLGALVLVWTGFALTWRRFFRGVTP